MPSVGSLFIIVAPSGAGKSSLVKALLSQDGQIQLSVSYTTRAPRAGEVEGVHYHFVNTIEFEQRIVAGEFIEYAQVHGNYYGTSRLWIAQALQSGKDVLLEIDWQGAQQVRAHFATAVGIFVLPPSYEVLRQRLESRQTDSLEVIELRMHNAHEEIAHAPSCEYVIINDKFDTALAQIQTVVAAARLRYTQQHNRHTEVFQGLGLPA